MGRAECKRHALIILHILSVGRGKVEGLLNGFVVSKSIQDLGYQVFAIGPLESRSDVQSCGEVGVLRVSH